MVGIITSGQGKLSRRSSQPCRLKGGGTVVCISCCSRGEASARRIASEGVRARGLLLGGVEGGDDGREVLCAVEWVGGWVVAWVVGGFVVSSSLTCGLLCH
jgi:hypothetical protein